MARTPKVWWHQGNAASCSMVGERMAGSGRRGPIYFQHSNSERGRRAAQSELSAYLSERDRREQEEAQVTETLPVTLVAELYFQEC